MASPRRPPGWVGQEIADRGRGQGAMGPEGRGRAGVAHLLVVGGVGKGEGQEALLLEVGLVDAGKRLDHHRARAQVARLQRGVLAGGPLQGGGRG